MKRIESSVLINAGVEDVFRYAADWQKWSEWFEGVSDFQLVAGTQHGNGARYQYKARIMGLNMRVETEIHDYVENSGWTGISTRGMPHTTFWLFEPVGNTTCFTYALEYKMPVPVIGALLGFLFVDPQWKRIIENSVSNFKARF